MSTNTFEEQAYEISELWDPEWFSHLDHERVATLGKLIPESSKTVLDVGCGNGLFLSYLSNIKKWKRICGCDRSKAALRHVDVENYVTEISKLPFQENEFEIVSCQEVLEHLPITSFEDALDELTRVAERMILISVPYAEDLKRHHNECPSCFARFHPDYHMRSFNEDTIEGLLVSRGFIATHIVKLAPFDISYHYRFMQRFRKNQFQNFTICPVCGFNRNEQLQDDLAERAEQIVSGTRSTSQRLTDRLKRILIPRHRTYRWIASVYQPATSQS